MIIFRLDQESIRGTNAELTMIIGQEEQLGFIAEYHDRQVYPERLGRMVMRLLGSRLKMSIHDSVSAASGTAIKIYSLRFASGELAECGVFTSLPD